MTKEEMERLINTMCKAQLKKVLITINWMNLEEYPLTLEAFYCEIRNALIAINSKEEHN